MNKTLKAKSSSTLPSQRDSAATPSVRLRIVTSASAASSVAHARRWTPFAGASSSRRSTQRPSETVATYPRSVRGQRETVPDGPTVADDDLMSLAIPDTTSPPGSTRRLYASQGSGNVCPVCRVPDPRCQCPESGICPLGSLAPRGRRRVTDAAADSVRRASTGQPDTDPDVTPVNSRQGERGTGADIAPANPTRRPVMRRLETGHVASARPRSRAMRIPAISQNSMSLIDSNAVDLPEPSSPQLNRVGFVSTPHLDDVGNNALYELIHSRALSRYMASIRGITGPVRAPQWLMDLLEPLTVSFLAELDDPGGLANEEICRLPVRKVPNSAIPSQPCIICLQDYERGDLLRVMPCHHEFHQNCLDRWLAIKRNCPVCRKVL